MTGVYETQVIVDETLGKISIEVGDDKIEEVIEAFLTYRLAIPLIPYTIGVLMQPILSQTVRQKNYVNFDFVYNRLPSKGISSKFNDVKFKISNVALSGGVRE